MKATAPVLVQCSECEGEGRVKMPFGPFDEMDWITCGLCGLCGGEGEVSDDQAVESEGDDARVSAPSDRTPYHGVTVAEVVTLKANALWFAINHHAPLIDPFTGRVIDRHDCPDAA